MRVCGCSRVLPGSNGGTGTVAGPSHHGALVAGGQLAYRTGRAGDAAGARDQYAALLPIFQRVLGPEHPDTLAARPSLRTRRRGL
jgi:hypothetical protein